MPPGQDFDQFVLSLPEERNPGGEMIAENTERKQLPVGRCHIPGERAGTCETPRFCMHIACRPGPSHPVLERPIDPSDWQAFVKPSEPLPVLIDALQELDDCSGRN